MSITEADVKKLANLSRLEFTPEAAAQIKTDLTNILGFISKLQEADTNGVTPTFSPVSDEGTRERPDEVTDTVGTDGRNHLQKTAPSADMGFYVVPQVIE